MKYRFASAQAATIDRGRTVGAGWAAVYARQPTNPGERVAPADDAAAAAASTDTTSTTAADFTFGRIVGSQPLGGAGFGPRGATASTARATARASGRLDVPFDGARVTVTVT